jgi:hypothetical protein
LASASTTKVQNLCPGIIEEHGIKIPVGMYRDAGLTEAQFHQVLDRVENFYKPIVAQKGATLVVNREWKNDTVNASAQQFGRTYRINMYGGLARHPKITLDGFLLVACHEMGHHLGGAPKVGGWLTQWASNEGQSDYFSSLRCMRALFVAEETEAMLAEIEVDPYLVTTCKAVWGETPESLACQRMGLAGMSVAKLFQALRNEETEPRFDTPDPKVVTSTDHRHPGTQCRLDTYFQGALCVHDENTPLNDTNPNQGVCPQTVKFGFRPKCWFASR